MNNEDFTKCSTVLLDCEDDPRLNFTFMKQDNTTQKVLVTEELGAIPKKKYKVNSTF